MTLQDSPSLDDYKNGYQKPPDPEKGKKSIRYVLGSITLFVLILAGVNFMKSSQADIMTRKGSIIGYAVDESENPIQVEVLVFGTDIKVLSNQNGFFEIDNVPAGEQSVIVAYDIIAAEEKVTVESGKISDLGSVEVPTEDLALFVDE